MSVLETMSERVAGELLGFPGGHCWLTKFEGPADMVRECRDVAATRPELMRMDPAQDSDWVGRPFTGWDDVVRAVDGTWKEGVDRVEELCRELEKEELPRPTVVKRRRVWDDFQGDEVCVDRWHAGEPFFRTNARVTSGGPRLLSILTQLGQNASYSSDSLFWRGALAVTLARIVEDAGYRTEITAFGMSTGTYESHETRHSAISVGLKGAGDALDIGSLVNVTSGWYFRTVYFGAMLAPREPVTGGRGRMKEATKEMVERISPASSPWVVSGVYNKQSAIELARQLLATLVDK